MICENCKKLHNGEYGSGRFCSQKCARSFSTRKKRKEINQKVSKTLRTRSRPLIDKICLECNKIFKVKWSKRNQQKFCSKRCSLNNVKKRKEVIEKCRRIRVEKIKSGNYSGWKQRKSNFQSFPEIFFERVLKNNKIRYEKEKKINRFWIDFALIDYKVALEIDGKQHDYPERRKHDEQRDKIIEDESWSVYRIKWRDIKSKEGKEYIKNKITKLLLFLSERGQVW